MYRFTDIVDNPDAVFSQILLTPVRDGEAASPIPMPVNADRVRKALIYLKTHNPLYTNVDISKTCKAIKTHTAQADTDIDEDSSDPDDDDCRDRMYSVPNLKDQVLNVDDVVGPSLSSTNPSVIRGVDAKAFPVLYPHGTPGLYQSFKDAKQYVNMPESLRKQMDKREHCDEKIKKKNTERDSKKRKKRTSADLPATPSKRLAVGENTAVRDEASYKSTYEYINSRVHSACHRFSSDAQFMAWALQTYEDEQMDRNCFYATRTPGDLRIILRNIPFIYLILY